MLRNKSQNSAVEERVHLTLERDVADEVYDILVVAIDTLMVEGTDKDMEKELLGYASEFVLALNVANNSARRVKLNMCLANAHYIYDILYELEDESAKRSCHALGVKLGLVKENNNNEEICWHTKIQKYLSEGGSPVNSQRGNQSPFFGGPSSSSSSSRSSISPRKYVDSIISDDEHQALKISRSRSCPELRIPTKVC